MPLMQETRQNPGGVNYSGSAPDIICFW